MAPSDNGSADRAGWLPVRHEDVDWSHVTRATFVPFIEDRGVVVIPEDGLPSDEIRPSETVILGAALRVPLEQAGFRRQGTHVFAMAEGGAHVAIWIDGDRYTGDRPHRRDARWWIGDPAEVEDELVHMADEARRSLTHGGDIADTRRVLDPSYLSADTPQGGSGFGGTFEEWTDRRRIIIDAIERDGRFLDVGCANGFLMRCVVEWCAEEGVRVEPYGVDVSPDLVQRARERLPRWADRIWVGDALTWEPPHPFDTVHALFDLVRPEHRRRLVDNLLTYVLPGGRLVLSHYRTTISARELAEGLGYPVDGETGAPRTRGTPSIWLTKTARD